MERPRFDIVASGERMREIRRQRNISVKQVMEYMGFESTQAVYKWEAGKCYPQADNLVALAILYNVSPMELLVEEDLVSSSSRLWDDLFAADKTKKDLYEALISVLDSPRYQPIDDAIKQYCSNICD